MPRPTSFLPLISSSSAIATTSTTYSKDEKSRKPFISTSTANARIPLLVFCFVSLTVGLAGIIFAASALRRPRPLPVFRCGRTQDTFRSFYSLSNPQPDILDRPKVLGFVGIQTGFSSANRRSAVRSTWFPSDPDGLLR